MSDAITFTIDGKTVHATAAETIWQVANRAGLNGWKMEGGLFYIIIKNKIFLTIALIKFTYFQFFSFIGTGVSVI